MKKLYLIDANSYLFRSYYAVSPIEKYRHDRAKSAIYGFTRMLMRLLAKEKPDYVVIAFDIPAPAMRRKKFVRFKARRPKMPPDLRAQIPYIKEVIRGFNIPIFELDGFAADDILATIALGIKEKTVETFLITGFKNALQLADRIKIINPHQKNLVYDRKMVLDRLGIEPEKVPFYLALAGDKSENIPGVPGIGAKRAKKIVNQFESFEKLLKDLDGLEKKLAAKIEEYKSKIKFGQKIARIDFAVPISFNLEDLRSKAYDYDRLVSLFQGLDFIDLLSSVSKRRPRAADYKLVLDENALDKMVRQLRSSREFSFDTETTGVNPHQAELVGLSFSTKKDTAWYVPLTHQYKGVPKQINIKKAIEKLRPVFGDEKIKKIAQNAKYDMAVLDRYGLGVKELSFDTMIASYALKPSTAGHSLETMALQWLKHKMIRFEELVPKDKTIADIDINRAGEYACEDVDITLQLKQILQQQILKAGLDKIFTEIDMPLCHILERAEQKGILVDKGVLENLADELNENVMALEKEIYQIAGQSFNLNSSSQISEVLFTKLKLPWSRKTKLGKISTARTAINKLSKLHPVVNKIIKHRELSKIRKNFILPLINSVDPSDSRIHPIYSQVYSAAGRITTSLPDLQTTLAQKDLADRIRKSFFAPDGFNIVNFDYSQLKIRVLAHFSQDKNLIDIFEKGEDIYAKVASILLGKKTDQISSTQRTIGKAVTRGIFYGISANRLAQELDISRKKAQQYIDLFFKTFPGTKEFFKNLLQRARRESKVETILGRRWSIPEINSRNPQVRVLTEIEAINAVVGGSASDIIKKSLVEIDKLLKQKKSRAALVLQALDEFIFEVPEQEKDELVHLIRDIMKKTVPLSVPLQIKEKEL